jgi:lysophospholipase L1-like esterase
VAAASRRTAQKLGDFLEQNPAYYLRVDSTHPNAVGHELIARRLATLILGHAPGNVR